MSRKINVILNANGNGRKIYENDGDVIQIEISDEDCEFLRKTKGDYNIETIEKSGNILNSWLTSHS